jgi:hypothetical protein
MRLPEIFRSALVVSGEDRSRHLDEACAGDFILREQVVRLLAAYEWVEDF